MTSASTRPSADLGGPSGWDELVTVALLGTDRRPLPAEPTGEPVPDPAARVLDLAARHRAVLLAGGSLASCPPPVTAPAERLTMAPRAAHELLTALLPGADPGLVNDWLSVCARRGLGVAPDLWPRLAGRAARNTGYDRRTLAQVLGPRGRWLMRQNPQWARLGTVDPATPPAPCSGDAPAVLALVAAGESAPRLLELLLDCPDPWPDALTVAALRLVVGGQLGAGTRAAAVSVALRIPLDRADDLATSLAGLPMTAPISVGTLRAVQLALVQLERTVSTRIEIQDSFRGPERPEEPQQETTGKAKP